MNDHAGNKLQRGLVSRFLILIGFFLFVASSVGPTLVGFLPADGFATLRSQGRYFRIVSTEESGVDFQLVCMLVGVVLLVAGFVLSRRADNR